MDGKLDFNGKGYAGGASVENEDTGHGKQGTSPTGVGIFAMTPNGGGGGGGQSNLAFGSAGGGIFIRPLFFTTSPASHH